jgi:glycosyltransferase involved in cell wall biosynthesis
MTELRILTVIETLGAGGAERALVGLLPALERRGHTCEVAVLTGPFTLVPELEAAGITVHRLGLRHRWDLRGIIRLARLARRAHFDVLHGHLFFAGFYVAATKPLARQPLRVVTFHNLGYESFPADTPWRRVRKRLDALLMRHAVDRRLAVSAAVADHYRRHLGVSEVEVVRNGFDTAALRATAAGDREATRAGLGLPPDADVLVAVGRMVPEKAYGDLVAALAALLQSRPRARLVVVGDGPMRPQVEEAIASAGVSDAVVLTGYRTHEDTIGIVACADVFVSASTHEGFPLAPAEAMAIGVPVVVTAVGGVPELVGDAGVVVRAGHPDELAAEIGALLADDDRRSAFVEAGHRRIADELEVDRVAEQLEGIYFGVATGLD